MTSRIFDTKKAFGKISGTWSFDDLMKAIDQQRRDNLGDVSPEILNRDILAIGKREGWVKEKDDGRFVVDTDVRPQAPVEPEQKLIYFLTVLSSDQTRSRCWGFYFKEEEAIESILDNEGDPFEAGYYDLAVIEGYPEGTHAIAETEKWFSAKYRKTETDWTHDVKPIPKPEQFEHTCNFALG
jgi:hypothetical protein